MSHFSKLAIQVKRMDLARKVANTRGWSITQQECYKNGWSGEVVQNPQVFTDSAGTVRLVLDTSGKPVVDAYYMGREYERFLQDYAAELITEQAMSEGANINHLGVNKQGELLLEVVYD